MKRTQAEIMERFNTVDDFMGIQKSDLIPYMTFENAKPFLKDEYVSLVNEGEEIWTPLTKAKLEVNYALHKKVCNNPFNCPINQGYERRIAFVQSVIEQQELIAPPMAQSNKKTVVQIEWLGTQKELAELFIELKKKGWISDFIADTIKECFTKSNSIQQVLKPHHDKKSKTKEPTYEGVYTPEYEPQFFGISKNKNPKTD